MVNNLENEIWKSIPGYENYFASNLGRIKERIDYDYPYKYSDENLRVLYIRPGKNYYVIRIGEKCKKKNFYVHQLIALAFLPNPENKPYVNHKNGVQLDNVVSNLEWATEKENSINRYERARGEISFPINHIDYGNTYEDCIKNLDGEIWKDVVGYEGLYQVSNIGRIKSLQKTFIGSLGRPITYAVKIMKPVNNQGYKALTLRKNKIRKTLKIHRLVAQAFIPNPENKPDVNHKDLNRSNNHVDNLEWCTRSENSIHVLQKTHYMYKYIYTCHELNIQTNNSFEMARQLQKLGYNVYSSGIRRSSVGNPRYSTHCGLTFTRVSIDKPIN